MVKLVFFLAVPAVYEAADTVVFWMKKGDHDFS